jgi:hypothetical protein
VHTLLNRSALRTQGRVRSCACCGRPLWLANAKKKFCSDRCRQANLRSRTRDRQFALSRSVGHHPSDLSRFAKKSPLISDACKAVLDDRASISGPPTVIVIEIVAGWPWQSTVSPDGVACEVADFTAPRTIDAPIIDIDNPVIRAKAGELIARPPDDLSIPDFLRRLPEIGSVS